MQQKAMWSAFKASDEMNQLWAWRTDYDMGAPTRSTQQISGWDGGSGSASRGQKEEGLGSWLCMNTALTCPDKHKIRMFAAREDRATEVPVTLGYTRHETVAIENVTGLVAHREGNLNSQTSEMKSRD